MMFTNAATLESISMDPLSQNWIRNFLQTKIQLNSIHEQSSALNICNNNSLTDRGLFEGNTGQAERNWEGERFLPRRSVDLNPQLFALIQSLHQKNGGANFGIQSLNFKDFKPNYFTGANGRFSLMRTPLLNETCSNTSPFRCWQAFLKSFNRRIQRALLLLKTPMLHTKKASLKVASILKFTG